MENIFNNAVEGIALTSVEEYVPNVKEAKIHGREGHREEQGRRRISLASLGRRGWVRRDELVTDNLAFLGKIREYLKAERAKTIGTL